MDTLLTSGQLMNRFEFRRTGRWKIESKCWIGGCCHAHCSCVRDLIDNRTRMRNSHGVGGQCLWYLWTACEQTSSDLHDSLRILRSKQGYIASLRFFINASAAKRLIRTSRWASVPLHHMIFTLREGLVSWLSPDVSELPEHDNSEASIDGFERA